MFHALHGYNQPNLNTKVIYFWQTGAQIRVCRANFIYFWLCLCAFAANYGKKTGIMPWI